MKEVERIQKMVEKDPRGRMAPPLAATQVTFLTARALAAAKKNLGKRPAR